MLKIPHQEITMRHSLSTLPQNKLSMQLSLQGMPQEDSTPRQKEAPRFHRRLFSPRLVYFSPQLFHFPQQK
ncbi:MAG TPA: hypothetical protein VIJ02_00865, partial [Thermoanaerobaculia bacterium]